MVSQRIDEVIARDTSGSIRNEWKFRVEKYRRLVASEG